MEFSSGERPFDRDFQPPQERGRKSYRSRWSPIEAGNIPTVPGMIVTLQAGLPREGVDALVTRLRIEEINRRLATGQLLDLDFLDRSPSPPPQYDMTGKRYNTREYRARERLNEEKQQLIEEGIKSNPLFRPPTDFKPRVVKKTKKIYIPYKEYPHMNFMGLLIGPRGMTLKQMEADTGTKIAIRGRGSSKDGKGRADGKPNPGDDDELHVLIQADNDESINKAAAVIEKLLIPIPEAENEHKKAQLRKLALLNGTLRDDEAEECRYCGSMLHRHWNCPKQPKPEDTICSLCNQKGHRLQECPLRADHGERRPEPPAPAATQPQPADPMAAEAYPGMDPAAMYGMGGYPYPGATDTPGASLRIPTAFHSHRHPGASLRIPTAFHSHRHPRGLIAHPDRLPQPQTPRGLIAHPVLPASMGGWPAGYPGGMPPPPWGWMPPPGGAPGWPDPSQYAAPPPDSGAPAARAEPASHADIYGVDPGDDE
ncbi:putative Branchpoint-bridging protein [Paratrimastix pyriformis]|uniref:Branchpoint-bridging protein n=1 Tax=Paratrimastix pyriformis TaxID=342808 RepID=A0ABQ8UMD6_9EUKA|nr:putative Branchpoint-bridging protein [Paratrimastix pyriformis]